ncbi:MAG: VCBS domain-containing protein, partial [Pseudomonadota bacterium]
VTKTIAETEGALSTGGSFDIGDVDTTDIVTVDDITLVVSGQTDTTLPDNATLLAMFSTQDAIEIAGDATTGTVNWDFNAGTDAFDYLAVGETLTLTYTITVTDDNGATVPQDVVVNITGTNDTPEVSVPESAGTLEDTALNIAGISVDDVDASDTLTVVVSATGTIALVQTTGLTVSGDGSDEVTLSGSVADINAALNSGSGLLYTPAADFNGNDTIQVSATDGVGLPVVETFDVVVDPVNDAPVGIDSTVTGIEDTNLVLSAADFGFSDPADSPADGLAAVQITGFPSSGNLLLAFGGGFINVGPFAVTVTVAQLNAGDLVYVAAGTNGNGTGFDSLQFVVIDDGGTTDGGADTDPTPNTLTIDITPVNDLPFAALPVGTTPLDYTEGDAAAAIAPTLTVTDVDNANLVGATVSFTAGFAQGEDVLGFVDQNGISGIYDATLGVLTLSGPSSVANYQTALASVTYSNTSTDPDETDREVSFVLSDSIGVDGPAETASISVTATDNTITGTPLNDTMLDGTAGDDTILGLAGFDIIDGLAGNDILIGGDNSDSLTGGPGSDTFVFLPETTGFQDADNVTDFNPNEDVIDLGILLQEIGFEPSSVDEFIRIEDTGTQTDLLVDDVFIASFTNPTTGFAGEDFTIIYDSMMSTVVVNVQTGGGATS